MCDGLVRFEPGLASLGKDSRVLGVRLPRDRGPEPGRRQKERAVQQLSEDEGVDERFPLYRGKESQNVRPVGPAAGERGSRLWKPEWFSNAR